MKKFLKDAMIVSILVTSILMLVLAIGILSPARHDLSEIVHIKLGNGFLTVPRGYLVGVMRAEGNGFIIKFVLIYLFSVVILILGGYNAKIYFDIYDDFCAKFFTCRGN